MARGRRRAGQHAVLLGACCVVAALVLASTPRSSGGGGGVLRGPSTVALLSGSTRSTSGALAPPLPHFGDGEVVFTGHMTPDADSVGSALGAAALYGGRAMIDGAKVNRETAFLLERFGVAAPASLQDAYRGSPFVIVDHNAFAQRPKVLNATRIRGIIDHHALSAEPTVVPQPVYVLVEPWGSCSSIIATKFLEHGVDIPPPLAGMLLGGLLSDTLNLRSPTTTPWDAVLRLQLGRRALLLPDHMPDAEVSLRVDRLAHEQFQAKANITGMSLAQVARADLKMYELAQAGSARKLSVGWSAVETVEPFFGRVIKRARTLATAVLPGIRAQHALDAAFLCVVDVERRQSRCMCSDKASCAVMRAAFPATRAASLGSSGAQVLDTTPRVSRKKEFLPAVRKALAQGVPA